MGIATHQQRDYMQLLCAAAIACEEQASLRFQKVSSVDELQQTLTAAHAQGRWVMLDFYADWCVSCKEMALYTFSDPKVRDALSTVVLVQADVTQNLQADQALLKTFNLVGPPAILFFGPDRRERESYRVIGYMKAEKFLAQLDVFPARHVSLGNGLLYQLRCSAIINVRYNCKVKLFYFSRQTNGDCAGALDIKKSIDSAAVK